MLLVRSQTRSHIPPLLSLRSRSPEEILETKRLSLPFTYHHLLTVVIMVNLSLLSYGSALSTTCLAPPIFFLVAIFFFGMMEVSWWKAALVWEAN